MEKIHAWIYDPTKSLFGDKRDKAALFTISCEDPSKCDLYRKTNTCRFQGAFSGCKFGKKSKREGFTRKAGKYYQWMDEARSSNEHLFDQLKSGKSYDGIFKAQDSYCLPYSSMSTTFGSMSPLESQWVPCEEMTAELLEKICTSNPQAMMGGTIKKYQEKVVPKFLHDLKTHYPELFDLLPEAQQKRVENISFVGRKADITTCNAGKYKMGTSYWDWDGEKLTGDSMLFQPAKGKITIEIEPDAGESVVITDNAQVSPSTVFLD